jgi:hypothetical protein
MSSSIEVKGSLSKPDAAGNRHLNATGEIIPSDPGTVWPWATESPPIELVVAQYTSLRSEIAGHRTDDFTVIGATIAITGVVISVATLVREPLLLAVIPVIACIAYTKLVSGMVSTYRIAAFIRAFYEQPTPNQDKVGILGWESAIENYRKSVEEIDKSEVKHRWANGIRHILIGLLLLPVIAAIGIGFLGYEIRNESRIRAQIELVEFNKRHLSEIAQIQSEISRRWRTDKAGRPVPSSEAFANFSLVSDPETKALYSRLSATTELANERRQIFEQMTRSIEFRLDLRRFSSVIVILLSFAAAAFIYRWARPRPAKTCPRYAKTSGGRGSNRTGDVAWRDQLLKKFQEIRDRKTPVNIPTTTKPGEPGESLPAEVPVQASI